ncbi:MAG: hypothetical protein AB7O97_23085 [Planctomycetota bacterium]
MSRFPAKIVLVLLWSCLPWLSGCSKHPLAGGWHQHVESGEGLALQFDPASSRLIVHAHGRTDGGDEHMDGEYTMDGQTLTLHWMDGTKRVQWTGSLQGDHLELKGADGKALEFHRGGDPHGH